MLRKLNHIGHLVADMNAALAFYKDALGLKPWELGVMELNSDVQKAKIAWLPIGGNFIELIQPVSGPLAELFKEKGEGPYHMSFLVEDFESEVQALKGKNYTLLEDSFDFLGQEQRVAFLIPQQSLGYPIELVDASRLPAGVLG